MTGVADIELHDEVVEWMGTLMTTFRKQRNNERAEVARARTAAELCARRNP